MAWSSIWMRVAGFLAEGRLLEQGSHAELMQKPGGAYRKLVEGEEAAARAEPVLEGAAAQGAQAR